MQLLQSEYAELSQTERELMNYLQGVREISPPRETIAEYITRKLSEMIGTTEVTA